MILGANYRFAFFNAARGDHAKSFTWYAANAYLNYLCSSFSFTFDARAPS
jgi:hypothetical protein